jgi:hypothetical protein
MPAPPPYGYAVPVTGPFWPAAPDPLVTAPGEGFTGWFNRLFAVLRRSWRSLLLISWITFGIPVAVLVVPLALAFDRAVVLPPPGGTQPPTFNSGLLGVFVAVVAGAALVFGFLTSAAQAAVVWSITRQAAGRPAPLGAALLYGLRNGLRLWGWSLLYAVMIAAGTCACILPGLYLALAGCLYVPVALYRRGMSPISTSFSLVNSNFWAALGRMALLLVMVYGVQVVLTIPVQILSTASRTLGLVLSIVLQLLTAPLALVFVVGSVLLFAELWAKRMPTTTADLNAALG